MHPGASYLHNEHLYIGPVPWYIVCISLICAHIYLCGEVPKLQPFNRGTVNIVDRVSWRQRSFYVCVQPMRRRNNVTSSLIGWAHSQNDPCGCENKYLSISVYSILCCLWALGVNIDKNTVIISYSILYLHSCGVLMSKQRNWNWLSIFQWTWHQSDDELL